MSKRSRHHGALDCAIPAGEQFHRLQLRRQCGRLDLLSGGACWVIVDTDNSLNNAGGAAGASLPMLLSEWSNYLQSPSDRIDGA